SDANHWMTLPAKGSRKSRRPVRRPSGIGSLQPVQQVFTQHDGVVPVFVLAGIEQRDDLLAREVDEGFQLVVLLPDLGEIAPPELVPLVVMGMEPFPQI